MRTMLSGAVLAATVVAGMAPAAAAPAGGCFATCMAAHPPKTDDYFNFADDVKACRDRCDADALGRLKSSGLYETYAACTPVPLSKQDFRDLRAANPSWQSQFNVFLWDVRNIFKDKVLTGIEVKTQDMNLIDVNLTADGVIAPGEAGTFVIPDFFDGYPAVRYATKVVGVTACTVE
jgi:hypothetical protein